MRARHSLHAPLALASVFVLAACGGSSSQPPPTETPPADCDAFLPGGSTTEAIQTALIEAQPGDLVCFGKGTFAIDKELSLDVDDVTLRGASRDETVFDFSGQAAGSGTPNGLRITSDGVTVQALSVKNTPGDGIRADSVVDITFRDLHVSWDASASADNGAYGLYPVGCVGVRIEACVVHGASDAGIYVGQSSNILVRDSEAFGNVAGIEIENSVDAEVVGNDAHDNTGGILIFNLPGLPMQGGARAKVHGNLIRDNNLTNFADPGSIVAGVPKGTGVLILASDDNELHDNEITGNGTAGLLMVAYTDTLFPPAEDPAFDAFAEGNWIHHNTFSGNGEDPDLNVAVLVMQEPVPDMVWDGCTNTEVAMPVLNCFSDNGGATYADGELCIDNTPETTLADVTCEYSPLPSQDP
jgi:parallel beta-helix repeat protein